MAPGAFRNMMRKSHESWATAVPLPWFAVALVAVVAPGCWNSPPPGRVTVTGLVSVEGRPLSDGEISFAPMTDGIGGGVAPIESGGMFSLFLRPGTYRVGIVSVEGGVSPAGLAGVDPTKLRVPARYAKPESSSLEYVIDSSNRRVTIDLSK